MFDLLEDAQTAEGVATVGEGHGFAEEVQADSANQVRFCAVGSLGWLLVLRFAAAISSSVVFRMICSSDVTIFNRFFNDFTRQRFVI